MSSDQDASQLASGGSFVQRHRDVLIFVVLFALMAFGLAGVAAATGWSETVAQLKTLTMMQIAALLALSLVNYVGRGLRWHVFATALGLGTQIATNLRHYLGGFAMSVTPGRVGELVRMRWINRETGWAFETTAPLVLVDRASDLSAMALILAAALTLGTGGIAYAVPVVVLALSTAVIVTRPKLLSGLVNGFYRLTGLFPRVMVRIRRATRSLRAFRTTPVITASTFLGTLGWFTEGYAFYLLLAWMGADVGMWMAIAIFIFSTLAGGLTGAPGGVGGAEAAMIALLTLEGVPIEASVAATAIIRLTTLWFAILIGLCVFPIAERISMKGPHALDH